jgi:DNA-binding GntR family transcriptional regulator
VTDDRASVAPPIGEANPPFPTAMPLPPEHAFPTLSRRVLADDVFDTLTAMVMDHVVPPGERLSIDGLAQQLSVSPTPVREALARLEAVGLAVKEPLRGYRTTPLLTRTQLDDLFEFRLMLEPWAAGRAAKRASAEATKLLGEINDFDAAPVAGYAHYRALADHDYRFHDQIMAMAGNEHARRAFQRTHCHLHIFRLYYVQQVGSSALHEHEAVARAVCDGDATAATKAMRTHLTHSRDRLRPITRD